MSFSKAIITIEHTGEQIPVAFNPEEYTLNHDNNFAAQNIPGLSAPVLQFVHGNMRTLEMELFFDTTDELSDVREQTKQVTDLLKIDSDLHAPPVLFVSWGSLNFRCVLARASQQFIRFMEDGRPIRARLNVTFNEFIDPEHESRAVNRQTSNFTKVHIGLEDETLADMAHQYYENPRMWRAIAIENQIDNPQSDFSGVALRIPSLPFVDPESGEVLSG